MTSPRFEHWQGDLIVSSLKGELVIGSDLQNVHFIQPAAAGDSLPGQSIYRVCAACHVAPAAGTVAIGPSLQGIVGRAVASDRDFEYSPAMHELGGIWTKARLDTFLADTRAFVPGSSMTFSGIPAA